MVATATKVALVGLVLLAAFGQVHAVAGRPQCGGKRVTIQGTNGRDVLRGTRKADVIDGRAGNDRIRGRGGNDIICAGTGHDRVHAGRGRDRVNGGGGDDLLSGAGGNDRLVGGGADAGDTFVGGGGNDTMTGSTSADDSFFPGSGDDAVEGGDEDDDFVLSSGGDESLDLGAGGRDLLAAPYATTPAAIDLAGASFTGDGTDAVAGVERTFGSPHNDTFIGDASPNTFVGWAGDDSAAGSGGHDLLLGNAGDDSIDGGADAASTSFESSASGVTVDLARNTAAGEGSDTLASVTTVSGSRFDDSLTGDEAANSLFGLEGNDQILGGAGDDFLDGGGESDNLSGEAGDDSLYFGNVLNGGPGRDDCFSGNEYQECEETAILIVDPCVVTGFTAPLPYSYVPAAELKAIRGFAYTALCPQPRRADLALVAFTKNGCKAWHPRRERLVAVACARPQRIEVDMGEWSHRLNEPLKPALYRAELRVVFDESGPIEDISSRLYFQLF